MLTTIQYGSQKLKINLSEPIDISIPLPLTRDNVGVLAWGQKGPRLKKIMSVKKKHATNFNSIYFLPHAHGTHTECIGHITKEFISLNRTLKQFFFLAEVVTVAPEKIDGDFVISKKQMQFVLGNKKREAIVIRTMPNTNEKLTKNYSKTNPPYLSEEAIIHLKDKGIEHLLIDLPSVDKEKDDGQLLGHNAFWNMKKGKKRSNATITELIFVNNNIKDGKYFLNLQIAPFENNASPSKPILYEVLN